MFPPGLEENYLNRAALLMGGSIVLAPSATSSEFVARASDDAALNVEEIVSSLEFISAEQLGEYAYALYESDKCVGIVNAANELELKDPMYPAV